MTVFGFAGDISSVNSGASSNSPSSSSVNGTIGIFPKEQKGEMQLTYQQHTVQGRSDHIHMTYVHTLGKHKKSGLELSLVAKSIFDNYVHFDKDDGE